MLSSIMNKIKIEPFIIFVILISILTLLPFLPDSTITQGQVGKQVFQAEQAKSYFKGETESYLPLRHFLEMHHEKIIPWGSEFPLYSLCVAGLTKITGLPLIVTGRLLSFAFFIILLYFSYKVGLFFSENKKIYLLFPLCISLFPVFRLYSISFMPDMAMTAFCMLGIYLSLKGRFIRAMLSFSVAALFKYYAVFTAFGIMLLILFSKKHTKKIKDLFLLAITPLPAILFLVYMFTNDIPNPITEYNKYFESGHMSSISRFLDLKIYFRALTWIFLKNPSLIGSLLIFFGIFTSIKYKYLDGHEEKRIFKLIGFLGISFILFIIIFGSAFYVHDYYGLQIAIATGLLASFAMSFILNKTLNNKKTIFILPVTIVAFLVLSVVSTNSSLISQPYYLKAAEKVKVWTAPTDKILVITDLVTPAVHFYSERSGWVLNIDYWKMYEKEIEKKLSYDHLKSIIIFVRKSANLSSSEIVERIKKYGWTYIAEKTVFPSTHRKIPETEILQIKRVP